MLLLLFCGTLLFQTANALRCYRCNDTELYSKKCVAENAEVVVCADTEQCGFGRTKPGKTLPFNSQKLWDSTFSNKDCV